MSVVKVCRESEVFKSFGVCEQTARSYRQGHPSHVIDATGIERSRRVPHRLANVGPPRGVSTVVDMEEAPPSSRLFRRPRPGAEVTLFLRPDLSANLSPPSAAARLGELRARGIDRVRVRVLKAPRGQVLTGEDAVKVEAPELTGDSVDTTVYVRLEFLDLPTI
jgi:hypothetical protein